MNARKTAIDTFLDLSYRHGFEGEWQSIWPGLTFNERGAARLMNVAGFITALHRVGREADAVRLAENLNSNLERLATYGGPTEIEVVGYNGEVIGKGEAPRFRVLLGDDATFGGFTISWYRLVTPKQRWAAVDRGEADPMYSRSSFQARWPGARKDEVRYTRPDGTIGWEHVAYRYDFNGGLLLHGMGHETFAVDISNDDGPHWSVHT